jgi:hypothetical protein
VTNLALAVVGTAFLMAIAWLGAERRPGNAVGRARVSEVDGPGMWRPERLVYGGSVRREL